MGLFNFKFFSSPSTRTAATGLRDQSSRMAELALNAIADGVLLIDSNNIIQFANPAAATMTGYGAVNTVIGLEYSSVLRLENMDGMPVPDEQNQLRMAVRNNQGFTSRDYLLVTAQSEKHIPIALTLTPTGGPRANKIITFRDIAKELEEENAQAEFISTASHEMRTPVASIEGYLGLALNPATATIDNRARQYLDAAHKASQHLGKLFKDLLDVTKLDDGRDRVKLVPVEIVNVVREMAATHEKAMHAKQLKYSFGAAGPINDQHTVNQVVYAAVDLEFLREILDNLIENAIKYTNPGGEIWVNARGDGDKVLINVTDTGIGIAADDMAHIFQKFYRVDNSQTRQVGGTGLGLYLVKQRVEAMGGRVWVESAFGDGTTFFVSLPRLSDAEYKKRLLAYQNEQAVKSFARANMPAVASFSPGAATNTITSSNLVQPITPPVSRVAPTVQPKPVTGSATGAAQTGSNVATTNGASQAKPAEQTGQTTRQTQSVVTPAQAQGQPSASTVAQTQTQVQKQPQVQASTSAMAYLQPMAAQVQAQSVPVPGQTPVNPAALAAPPVQSTASPPASVNNQNPTTAVNNN